MPKATPTVNLLVLRSTDLQRAAQFYHTLGLVLTRERHGDGPEHYSSSVNGFVFELYPLATCSRATTSTRIGFRVDSVDQLVPSLRALGAGLVTEVHDSPWGRWAGVRDLDGHPVELLTRHCHIPPCLPL